MIYILIDLATALGPDFIASFDTIEQCMSAATHHFYLTDEMGDPVCVAMPKTIFGE